MCVQLRGATGTNTAGVEKVRKREKKVPKSGLTKLVLVTQRLLKKRKLSVNGAQCKVVDNVCFVAAYSRQKSAYTVNRKALKC